MVSDPGPTPLPPPDGHEDLPDAAVPDAGLDAGDDQDVAQLRETVEELRAKLEKKSRKAARWKGEAKAERVRSAKLEAALRRATLAQGGEGADLGDVPVDPPLDDGGSGPRD